MIGEVKLFDPTFGDIPAGWHVCDGSIVGSIRLPKMGEIAVTAHLEPEGDGTHEKVIAQAKTDGLVAPKGLIYIICLDDSSETFTAAQEARIRQIAREEIGDR